MANARKGNVMVVDTTANFTDNVKICGIKYIGGTTGSASLALDANGGITVWSDSGNVNTYNPELEIRATNGFGVTVSGTGTVVYIYIE